MAIYICSKCRFCFERRGPVDACPNCGHKMVRGATKEEKLEYKRGQEDEKSSENEKLSVTIE